MYTKIASAVLIAISLFVVLATASAMTTLGGITEPHPPHLTAENLLTGNAHHLYLADETCADFPSRPWPLAKVVSFRAFGMMAVLVGAAVWIGRRMGLGFGHPLIAAGCLLSAAIPYAIGFAALADNRELERVGPWLSTMLLSILYGGIACAVLAGSRLIPFDTLLRVQSRRLQRRAAAASFSAFRASVR